MYVRISPGKIHIRQLYDEVACRANNVQSIQYGPLRLIWSNTYIANVCCVAYCVHKKAKTLETVLQCVPDFFW